MSKHPSMLRATALGGLLAAAALSGPADARKPRPVELTETTVVTATHSSWVDVALYDDAVLAARPEHNPDVDVAGSGRLLGLTLRSLGTGFADTDELSVYRLPAFLGSRQLTEGTTDAGSSCSDGTPVGPTTVPVGGNCTYTEPKHIVLHEGLYRLSVLTDGSPVTFTLTLHGLDSGSRELTPTHVLASTQQTLPKLDGAGTNLVTFGATAHLAKAEPAYLLAAAKGSANPTYYEESVCVRQDGGVPAPPLAFGPHCPNGVAGSYSYRLNPGPTSYGGMSVFSGSLLPGHEGDYAIGGSFGDSGGITLTNALGVWMEPTPA
ncbi:MAG: hypothetical protein QOJ92_2217 [Frankiales bacterium]|nr:hypothetical protein [Frankiales bacterium]